jgi:flagellar biogenesis protein FliO
MIRCFLILFLQTTLFFTPYLMGDTETKAPYFNVDKEEGPEFGDSTFWGEMLDMLITLGMIIGILVALTWVMRKMQTSRVKFANESSVIKVIDHRPLSTKSAVYLLQVYDRAIAIADSPSGISLLAEFPLENHKQNDFRDYLEKQK